MRRTLQRAAGGVTAVLVGFMLCAPATAERLEGSLPSGATYIIEKPDNWNGAVLLFNHGFNPGPKNPARNGPKHGHDELLRRGYALIGSSYRTVGWIIEDAIADQLATLDVFEQKYGRAKRRLVWGESMGGLISLAIIETHPDRFDGALPMCASVAGVIGMMNQAYDAAFALKSLVDPGGTLRIVDLPQERPEHASLADDEEGLQALLNEANATPQGKARATLAAVLAQIPDWIDPKEPEPAPQDFATRQANLIRALPRGAFFPRRHQEAVAGGNASWNVGVDYGAQLDASGRRAFVEEAYRRAGLDLERDLATLAAAPRTQARPSAVRYMMKNYVPSGNLARPVLALHTDSDPLTTVSHTGTLADYVAAAGKSDLLRVAITHQAGHCNFTQAETTAALVALDERVISGRWDAAEPGKLNQAVASAHEGRFIRYTPPRMLRQCSSRECPGAPTAAAGKVSEPGRYEGYSASYPETARSSQYVEVDDGRLAVTLIRPARNGIAIEGKLPTVVFHYRTGVRPGVEQYAQAGYNVLWIQQRGFGASFGPQKGFVTPRNGADVRQVISWAAQQPWSNGISVMAGGSHGGLIQWMTAREKVPGLKALTPSVTTARFYSVLYPNGASAMGGPGQPGARPRRESVRELPVTASEAVDADPPPHPLLRAAKESQAGNIELPGEWLENMHRDTFNEKLGYAPGLAVAPVEHADAIDAAGLEIYDMGGWYDLSVALQLLDYTQFGSKILIGDWPHVVENPMQMTERLRWFDRWAKGIENGVDREPPVYYRTIHAAPGEEWNFAAEWPLPSQVDMRMYFDTGRSGTVDSVNDGTLKESKPRTPASDRYEADFEAVAFDGKFVRLNRYWEGDMTAGLDRRALTYTGSVLSEDLEITGHPVAHLWVSSTARDGNFIVWVEDVDPSGKSRFVTDGAIRASHRKMVPNEPYDEIGIPYHPSLTKDDLQLAATTPVELVFDITPTSYVFGKGHRIRVSITAGERDTYQQAPGIDPAHPPTIRLYRGGRHASFIQMPVIPARSRLVSGYARVKGQSSHDGPASLYLGRRTSFLRLGEEWVHCSGNGTARGRAAALFCDRNIGPIRLTATNGAWRATGKAFVFESAQR